MVTLQRDTYVACSARSKRGRVNTRCGSTVHSTKTPRWENVGGSVLHINKGISDAVF